MDPLWWPTTKELLRSNVFDVISIGNRKTLKNTHSHLEIGKNLDFTNSKINEEISKNQS